MSFLVANPKDRFSRDKAHMQVFGHIAYFGILLSDPSAAKNFDFSP